MPLPQHTLEYDRYLVGYDKLQQFVHFSKSLDPDAEAIKVYRSSFFTDIKNTVVERAKDRVLTDRPTLANDPVQFASAVTDLQNEIEEEVWEERLLRYHTLRNELTIVQLVTIVEVYISEALRLMFSKKDVFILKIITDDHFMRFKELLKYGTIDEVKGEIIERMVQQTMKRSILRMIGFIQECAPKHFSLSDPERIHLERFWDTRNLIIHQNSAIDEAYSVKYSIPRGGFLQIDEAFIQSYTSILQQVLDRLDTAVYIITI